MLVSAARDYPSGLTPQRHGTFQNHILCLIFPQRLGPQGLYSSDATSPSDGIKSSRTAVK